MGRTSLTLLSLSTSTCSSLSSFPFTSCTPSFTPELDNPIVMGRLCYSANKGSDDAYDVSTSLTEGEEFLEVMSMDQRAGAWPVEEDGGSTSSGPAVPEDDEEGEPVKKACGADSTNSIRPRGAHVAESINIVLVGKRRRFHRLPVTAVT